MLTYQEATVIAMLITWVHTQPSSRVPVPLPEDPNEAISQAYLVGTDTESKPFEGEAEAPESPHTIASLTLLPDSTPPTCCVEESEGSGTSGARSTIARMAVRVLHVMLPGLFANIAEVAAMSDSVFWGELGEEDDEEVEESLDSDRKDDGPSARDEGPTAGDEGLAARDEGPDMRVESLGLGGDDTMPKRQQLSHPVKGENTRCDDTVHRTRYKIIHFTFYNNKT
uniref:Uncharacterized protein n=1 Tax=Tanacetum cinerariifolium TaxID=118510 RepID=A0A6L2NNZ4_TANCI|nr:hypothetical protein [Tanacetum cinerariifolium]